MYICITKAYEQGGDAYWDSVSSSSSEHDNDPANFMQRLAQLRSKVQSHSQIVANQLLEKKMEAYQVYTVGMIIVVITVAVILIIIINVLMICAII